VCRVHVHYHIVTGGQWISHDGARAGPAWHEALQQTIPGAASSLDL